MQIFSKFDRENKGGLAWKDIQEMVYSNMNIVDPTGWWVGTRVHTCPRACTLPSTPAPVLCSPLPTRVLSPCCTLCAAR